MSQVEHFAERSFAIKGTLVFTAQRDQFTIMEDAYLVCDGKKVVPLMTWATHVLQWRKQREAEP